jgi:probable DNA metabolism protein
VTQLTYDGTWEGLLTAVFDAYAGRLGDVYITQDAPGLFESRMVATDKTKAARVEAGLRKQGGELLGTLYSAFLSCLPVENHILGVMRKAFAGKNPLANVVQGPRMDRVPGGETVDYADEDVRQVLYASRQTGMEINRFMGFVRFVEVDVDNGDAAVPTGSGVTLAYAADIAPGPDILERLGRHFHERFQSQRFIIRDTKRRKILCSDEHGWWIVTLGANDPMPPLPKDGVIEEMWKRYFKTIANPARKNLKLQQHFVPKKYRENLTEFRQ